MPFCRLSPFGLCLFGLLTPLSHAAFEFIGFEKIIDEGLVAPLFATHAGDGSGRLFILEQEGRIRIYDPAAEGEKLLPLAFLDLTEKVIFADDERGLLGLAFHPDFAANGRFFVQYSDEASLSYSAGDAVVAEYRVSPPSSNVAQTSETVILRQIQPDANHNGGSIEFGPDRCLYIAMGDGGGAGDFGPGHAPEGNGQSLQTLMGKILRIDIDLHEDGRNYAIPPDNPFLDDPNALDEIYAYGFRNPYRFNFDPAGDHAIYAADVGQSDAEEVNIILPGRNYGWPTTEGLDCYRLPDACDQTGIEPPLLLYRHSPDANDDPRRSVIGGYVYRGAEIPELVGYYVFADFNTGEIWALGNTIPADVNEILLSNRPHQISGFGQGEDLELYVMDYGGGDVYKFIDTRNRVRNFDRYE